MRRGALLYSLLLCFLVIFFLGILSALPPIEIGNFKFKKVDMLSAIRPAKQTLSTALSVLEFPELDSVQATIDSVSSDSKERCKPWITCIEDYSADSTALHHFLKALSELKNKK